MLHLILAESALELVPEEIRKHPVIRRYARKRGKRPGHVLLDSVYHYAAMKNLPDWKKRGRPDIAYITLVTVMDTPLNKAGMLRVYVHTLHDEIIRLKPNTRLPRGYHRFVGLMEQVLIEGKAPPDSDDPLIWVERGTVKELVERIKPKATIGFSLNGEKKEIWEVFKDVKLNGDIAVIVGGFPHGEFKRETLKVMDKVYCVDPDPLCAWTVALMAVFAYSLAIGLRRFG